MDIASEESEAAVASDLWLRLLPGRYAVVRREPDAGLPDWIDWRDPFVTVTRTADELSILVDEGRVPGEARAERGLRLLEVLGPLSFEAYGVMHALTGPLAAARLWLLALSTFDTDYLVVRETDLEPALHALRRRFEIHDPDGAGAA